MFSAFWESFCDYLLIDKWLFFQIDLTELLESWAAENIHVTTDPLIKVKPVWRDASFTLKYYSDALFDFPHWFGFSKRTFKASASFFYY